MRAGRTTIFLSLALAILLVPDAVARIISYAPVTSRFTRPAVQPRDASRFLLIESREPFTMPSMFPGPAASLAKGELVLHDPSGINEPKVVFTRTAGTDRIDLAAMNETADGRLHLLVVANPVSGVSSPSRYFYSGDGGESWTMLALAEGLYTPEFFREDVGSPVVRGRGSQIRPGDSETPFVIAASLRGSGQRTVFHAIDAGGTVRALMEMAANTHALLLGSDLEGKRFLISGRPIVGGVEQPDGIRILDADGTLDEVLLTAATHPFTEGWITSGGEVYLEEAPSTHQTLRLFRSGSSETLVSVGTRANNGPVVFAVPTHDFEGAWIVERKTGEPTRLLRHTVAGGLETMWTDLTGPEVEAIHPAASGERVLVQVHRPRAVEMRVIVDPALAIWEIGAPAPRRYDELFLAEGPAKAFVNLDVDAVASGGSFIFDSAPTDFLPPPPISSAPGGMEVTQEWGVVRASLQQRLVLPALARLPGAYDSYWKSDVILWNDDPEPVSIAMRFVPTGGGEAVERHLELEGNRIVLIADALPTLFGLDQGGGAVFLEPEHGRAITVTSRLYTEGPEGSYGMGVGATDVFAASSARFFLTFAGALQGPSTRTNLLVTDAGGFGSRFGIEASGPTGPTGRSDLAFEVPAGGQIQINDVGARVGVLSQAAARFETLRGLSIPSLVLIDNRTNDPTMFPPDVVASVPRMIPFVGHLDGANGSRFRTDLFLYNTADEVRGVTFAAKALDRDEPESWVSFTLLPRESKIIPDAYRLAFGREGLGRLRFWSARSAAETEGVRVAARIYTEKPDGGTYGFVMPALNAFQTAGPGESLEILGAVIDPRFRTNLALVDTFTQANGGSQRVEVEIIGPDGARLDRFETTVRNAGGTHLLDLFGSRGLTADRPTPVVIRVSPGTGVVGAFATLVDNGTSDPIYLGAALASQ
ncbi:MAG TPA: hypothetical protein VMS56_05675 [Thermoanaerobaculia bacterium]|nr:hypothetical protein [Thermoanaerobaculia bacterium]